MRTLPQLAKQRSALRLAFATGLRAHAAMLVVLRMLVALCPACGARERTRVELRTEHRSVGFEQPRYNSARRTANLRAIQVQANTSTERIGPAFTETSVGARRTRATAGGASVCAVADAFRIGQALVRARSEYCFD